MRYGNGIVGDMAIHMFDMTRWMMGLGWPRSVTSDGGIYVDKKAKADISDTQTARFAYDDLDDATGDLVCATLILGARRRGPGLAAVLEDLAASVAEEVRIRRGIEADRAKPRTTARWVTALTFAVLGVLTLDGAYIAPYKTSLGQLALIGFLALYVGCLFWLRQMTRGARTPRFLPATSTGA